MVTPELLEYVRAEVGKGKTREEIQGILIKSGGWSEADLSEVFRAVIPMQNTAPLSNAVPLAQSVVNPSFIAPELKRMEEKLIKPAAPVSSFSFSRLLKFLIIFIILGGIGFGAWYYRSSITGVLPSFVLSFLNLNKEEEIPNEGVLPDMPVENNLDNNANNNIADNTILPNPTLAPNSNPVAPNLAPVVQPANQIKDCGTGVSPKLGDSAFYENDPILACLGVGASSCENVKGILKDDYLPTIFEVIKLPTNSCNFKLSYGEDSTLTDITGKKLAGQYIMCPVSVVKAMDNTKPALSFISPDKTNLSKYASQIYFYGTLGLFIEKNLDSNKIKTLGCEGGYIQSVIKNYSSVQKK